MNKKYLLGLGAVVSPLIVMPTVLSCNNEIKYTNPLQRGTGVNGLQVLDSAYGALQLASPLGVNRYSPGPEQGNISDIMVNDFSMYWYKFKLELVEPSTNQITPVEFSFAELGQYNKLAKLINNCYLNGAYYNITFYRYKERYKPFGWNPTTNQYEYTPTPLSYVIHTKVDDTYYEISSKEYIPYFEKIGSTVIQLNNFAQPLTIKNLHNLNPYGLDTTNDPALFYLDGKITNQDGWNNQYAGGRVPNGINKPRLNRA